ncbi:MAG: hypothetical protein QOH79_2904 [Acidimicrobiaceae bacterium]
MTTSSPTAASGTKVSFIAKWWSWLGAKPGRSALLVIPFAPLVFLGYGTDIDVTNVRSAADTIRHGSYQYSRPPGALPHEFLTAVLDRVGGSVLVDLGSLAVAAVILVLVSRLLRGAGSKVSLAAAAAIAANPFFIIAATSLLDQLWALAFFLGGLDTARSERSHRSVIAGALFGLAIGTRVASAVLVAAALLVMPRRSALVSGVTTAVIGGMCFIPAWLSAGRSSTFLENQFAFNGWAITVGRWVAKEALFIGLPACVVLIVGLPILTSGVLRWRDAPLARFAVLGAVGTEIIFLRFPWKLSHLLPTLVSVVIVLALSPKVTSRFLLVFAATQLLWGFVAIRTVVPDNPDAAHSGRWSPAVVMGPLLNDIRCRSDDTRHLEASGALDDSDVQQTLTLWACTNSWWGGGARDVVVRSSAPSASPNDAVGPGLAVRGTR